MCILFGPWIKLRDISTYIIAIHLLPTFEWCSNYAKVYRRDITSPYFPFRLIDIKDKTISSNNVYMKWENTSQNTTSYMLRVLDYHHCSAIVYLSIAIHDKCMYSNVKLFPSIHQDILLLCTLFHSRGHICEFVK